MIDIKQIDKWLNWYQQLSIKQNEYLLLGGYESLSKHLLTKYSDVLIYADKTVIGANDSQFYIPSLVEWSFFQDQRMNNLDRKIEELNKLQSKSILDSQRIYQTEFDKTYQSIIESKFLQCAIGGMPIKSSEVIIPKEILVNGELITIYGDNELIADKQELIWPMFIIWIVNVDYANWLRTKIEERLGKPALTIKNERNTIALYYYYLGISGEKDLSDYETLINIAKEKNISRKTLSTAWNTISRDKNARTGIEDNSISYNKKKYRIIAVIELLKESGNSKAISLAEMDREVIEKKIRKIEINKPS